MVGPEALERGSERAPHVLGRPVGALAHVVAELGRENDAVSPSLQQLAEELLAAAAVAIDVRRVEEGDAGFERGVYDLA